MLKVLPNLRPEQVRWRLFEPQQFEIGRFPIVSGLNASLTEWTTNDGRVHAAACSPNRCSINWPVFKRRERKELHNELEDHNGWESSTFWLPRAYSSNISLSLEHFSNISLKLPKTKNESCDSSPSSQHPQWRFLTENSSARIPHTAASGSLLKVPTGCRHHGNQMIWFKSFIWRPAGLHEERSGEWSVEWNWGKWLDVALTAWSPHCRLRGVFDVTSWILFDVTSRMLRTANDVSFIGLSAFKTLKLSVFNVQLDRTFFTRWSLQISRRFENRLISNWLMAICRSPSIGADWSRSKSTRSEEIA